VLEVRVLGPVEAALDTRVVPVTSARQRALLAALALQPNEVVSVDALLEALWGDELPSKASGNLQVYVSRLRAALGADAVKHEHGGYRLSVGTDGVDVGRVQQIVNEARTLRPVRPAAAAERFAEALKLWRGRPLGDLADNPVFVPDVARLDELRATLIDEHHDALLAAGSPEIALPGLEAVAAAAPLREPAQLLLMRALHAAGRSAEALRAGERYRRRLVEATGLDPTPELARLEQRILVGEPTGPVATDTAGQTVPARRPMGLPRPGRFVGRGRELGELRICLERERLVSIVGPGGVGKTRLVAEALSDTTFDSRRGVVVELAGVSEPDVTAAVAAALDLKSGADSLGQSVLEYLAIEDAVLVLDNCEHVAAPVRAFVQRVLGGCPAVTVLATSRERLGLAAERVLALGPLPVDDQSGDGASDAVELFLDRAGRVAPNADLSDRAAVTRLCWRLDGVPLALELAAGRVGVFGVAGLLDRLDEALDLLATPSHGAATRHETLRAVIDWSHRLLDPDTASFFHVLAVFEPGFGLDAVESVGRTVVESPTAMLARLADASLVLVDPSEARPRYRMLDAVRTYASERLTDTDAEQTARAEHARFYLGLLDAAVVDAVGPREAAAVETVLAERDNIRRALRWVFERRDGEAVSRAAVSLARLLLYRPDAELLAWLRAAADADWDDDPSRRAATYGAAARAAFLQGDLATSEALANDAAARLTPGLQCEHGYLAWHALGVVRLYRGDHDAAVDAWSRVVGDPDADPVARADSLSGIGLARLYAGDLVGAAATTADLEDLAELLESDTYRAFASYVEGELRLTTNRSEGVELLTRAEALAHASGAHFVVGLATTALVSAFVRMRRPADALPRFDELIELWRRSSIWTQQWTTLRLLAELLADEGRQQSAMLLLEAADHDPASPAVTGGDARRLARLRSTLVRQLGDDRSNQIRRRARSLSRARVVDAAMAAMNELRVAPRA
jgi:predicted ATPase/DNA-binding SARP family transcriptional activator